jgi:hypothetical protein
VRACLLLCVYLYFNLLLILIKGVKVIKILRCAVKALLAIELLLHLLEVFNVHAGWAGEEVKKVRERRAVGAILWAGLERSQIRTTFHTRVARGHI